MTQLNDTEIKFKGGGGSRGSNYSRPSSPRPDRERSHDVDERRYYDRGIYYFPYWKRNHPYYDDYYSNYNRNYYPKILNYTVYSPFVTTINNIIYNYPVYPTLDDIQRMKIFILSLPSFVPCQTVLCKNYIQNYVNSNVNNLNSITSSKPMLNDFFNDFTRDITNKFNTEIIATENNYRFNGII